MQFLPRIKPVREPYKAPYSVPEKCKEILEKIRNEKKPVLRLEKTDPSKIIYMLSTFAHRTAAGIEKQLNKYFMRELPTKCCFLTTFIHDEAQIRTMGMRKLKYPYRVLLGHGVVEELYQKSTTNKTDPLGCLHPELHRCFGELLVGVEGSLISIPVFPPEDSAIKFFLFSILDPHDDLMFIIQFVYETFRYCLPTLTQAIIYDLERFNRILTESTLNTVGLVYSNFAEIEEVINIILTHVIELTHSMDGCFYLIDPEDDLKARVYSTITDQIQVVYLRNYDGIVGRSARTGLSIIIKRNEPDLIEVNRHLKVKCMFSCPIFYKEQLVCVILLYNKRSGDYMLQDCHVMKMLEESCGEILAKCVLYYKSKHFSEHCQFSYRMLTNYIKFDDAAVEQILTCAHNHLDIDSFEFETKTMMLPDMDMYTLKIFESFNLLERFKIDRSKFAKFILHVKFAFQDLPFHNWTLAFSSLHFAFVIVSSMKLIEEKILSEFEVFILLLICLTHNLGYHGPVNAFKLQLGAPLENLYTSNGQIVETHNFCQILNIMGLNECNFLQDFNNTIYVNILELINKYYGICDVNKNPSLINEPTISYPSIFTMKPVPAKIRYVLITSIIHLAAHSDYLRDFKSSLNAFRLLHQEIQQTKQYSFLPNNNLPNAQFNSIGQLNKNFLRSILKPSLLILSDLIPDLSHFLDKLHEISIYWKYSCQVLESLAEGEDVCEMEILNRSDFEDKVLEVVVISDERSEFERVEVDISSYMLEMEEEEEEMCDYSTSSSTISDDEDRRLLAALERGSTESILPDVF